MRLRAPLLPLVLLPIFAASMPQGARAADPCSGHQLLSKPRPEASCQTLAPQIFISPDKTMHALVLPVDISLFGSPDMESRVVIRTSSGDTSTSRDHSSPRGMNGYYVDQAKWSPDSQFFVYSLISSGGHSPWQFPMMVYGRKKGLIVAFSDLIGGRPTLSASFTFPGPHTLTATTWKSDGAIDDKVPVTIDLDAAFAKLPPGTQ